MKNILRILLLLSSFALTPLYADSTLWSLAPLARGAQNTFELMPERYSLYQLDEQGMQNYLNYFARNAQATVKTLSIPLPNEEMLELVVTESSVMAPELAAKFPQIKTYKVTGVDRPNVQGVVDINELGFHGMLLLENGKRLFIDPRQSATGKNYYISYYDNDYHPINKKKLACNLTATPFRKQTDFSRISKRTAQQTDVNIKTYRLAMAATGDYTAYHGRTVSKGLSAIVTTVARVNQIFERDLAVKLELIANNDKIIFIKGNTDPYQNIEDDVELLEKNQVVIDDIIGTANYDIGHLLVKNNENGGIASVESVCYQEEKASAMTGHSTPKNDPFDIDYVAHEIGHQFGARHSFNASLDCNRDASSAWEIGNGVTIMGYTGVCDPDNDVQSNSIAMFHAGNLKEMNQFIHDIHGGASCGKSSTSSNQPPTADAGKDYTIPAKTPFQLTATANDTNASDTLSYTWDQMDLGESANISDGDKGDNPLFRAFLPTNINTRFFPQLSDILKNTQTKGEILPTTSRELTFILTVRDQKGGVAQDDIKLTVIKTSSPFKITSQTRTETITAGKTLDVSWNTGGTRLSPIRCREVDISLSIDGGQTFATELASKTANDGNQSILIPLDTKANSSTRLKVACHDNIFFDISEADLTIINTTTPSDGFATSFKEKNSKNHVNYFKLSLNPPLAVDASVSFETRDGTAKAGTDYIASKGTAIIKAGETERLIGVTIIADNIAELDETFSLVITEPVKASFANSLTEIIATHTILNDD